MIESRHDDVVLRSGSACARIQRCGAQLRSLVLEGEELLWPGSLEGWKDSAPLLFPVVGRLWQDELRERGIGHFHPMHGLARRVDFEIQSQSVDQVRWRWEQAGGDAFPWAFRLVQEFRLTPRGLQLEITVENPSSDVELPFQLGWHPGIWGREFRVGWDRPQSVAIHEVVPGQGWRTGEVREVLPNGTTGFRWQEQPTAWVADLDAGVLRIDGAALPLEFTVDPAPRAWTFWQGAGQEFLCPEPWFGLPDRVDESCDFSNREGTILVAPGAVWRVVMAISVRKDA